MKLFYALLLSSLISVALPINSSAATGSVRILAPENNAVVDADEEYLLDYEVILGKGDDHFHVWVDEIKSPAQRTLKGSYTLPKLSAGKHTIYIKVVDKGHVPTGPEQTINVTAR